MINDRYIDLLKDKYKESYSLYKKNKPLTAFSSHQPVLIHLLNTIKEGRVLEFGMGYNSTPIMNLICGMQDRKLLSLETDEVWLNKFIDYKGENHNILFMKPHELAKYNHKLFSEKYSIVFVDGAPAQLRQPFLEKIKDSADYIIIHDTECVVQGVKNVYAFDFSMFKHVHHFKSSLPMTSLVSNMDIIDEKVLEIFKGYE